MSCQQCGTELRVDARFCDACGASISVSPEQAEYKQVTVLFADVVRSMDIASVLDTERLREVMTELFNRCAVVVKRYGGTVDKFTGDGIMALFGAPAALEDHAFRACLAALDIHRETERLAADVERRDGVALRLRVGLNSGRVIVGDIGSSPLSYTAIGEQVGLAQRMESVAPPGAVMLSESTARLVEHFAVLGEQEKVHIKGADDPVPARRLLSTTVQRGPIGRRESTLVGRRWELSALAGILDESSSGTGRVVGVVGPPGIGKSRLVDETAAIATSRRIEVFATFCESYASEVPFHVAARLLRAVFGVNDLDREEARARVQTTIPDADPDDLLLLGDLLGIRDPDIALPDIDPDARRRRLARLLNTASLARRAPAVLIIEDAHWIDPASESMFADFLSVTPRTRTMVLITYRPEYLGALARTPGAQMIALKPLDDSDTSALTCELLGPHPSTAPLAAQIAQRAAGNPFFAEEIVRDLAERGVIDGERGAYVCREDIVDVSVPATLQATISARIDRLDAAAKRTLNAAAVIGSRFGDDLLRSVLGDSALAGLVDGEFIDQVSFTPHAGYAFRHPLIRAVAYDSQLKSSRAELHRRLATEIEHRDPSSADANAALIAEHVEAAGDLHVAFAWHMRAGTWSLNRDVRAARMSWQRARQVADRLPTDDPDRSSMRITPRTLLCGSAFRTGGSVADAGFDELRDLALGAGDERSLAIGMSGLLMVLALHARYREAARIASEYTELIESIGDPTMTIALSFGSIDALQEAGEVVEALRLAQRVIELADGDPARGALIIGSPLALAMALRGASRSILGLPGWRDDMDAAIAMARAVDPFSFVAAVMYKSLGIANGALVSNTDLLSETAEALVFAEQCGDDMTLSSARLARGITLVHRDVPDRGIGFALLAEVRDTALRDRFSLIAVQIIDAETATEHARTGDTGRAIDASRAVIDNLFSTGQMMWRGGPTTTLVESLLRRGADGDLQEAHAAIERLASVPTDPGFVLHELPLLRLRALLARAHGDDVSYRTGVRRYRAKAIAVGYEGHIALAKAMT